MPRSTRVRRKGNKKGKKKGKKNDRDTCSFIADFYREEERASPLPGEGRRRRGERSRAPFTVVVML